MTGARTVLLGDVCKFVGGGTPSRAQPEYFQGDIPWATVKDFKTFLISDTKEHISEVAIAGSATNIISPGTVLLVTRVGLGKVAIAGCRLAINQDVKAITPTDDVLPEFLFWFLLSKANDIQRMGAGATVKGVTLNDIKSITMPVPTIPEQRHIVDILSRAEGIVRLRREAEKKAAELIPTVFLDMFGDPATNPKGWPKLRLDEICEVSYGIADKLDTSISKEQGLRILTISNVLLAGVIDPTVERYCFATENKIRKCSVERGDLLFNWRNGSESHIGKTALWESDEKVLHVSFLLRLRPNAKRLNSHFLWAMLNLMRARGYFISVSRQQINRKFNASELSELALPIPSKELQDHFANSIEQIRAIQSQQVAATAKARATFDALMAQVFSK